LDESFVILNQITLRHFLGSHGSFFHFVEKHERLLGDAANAFIDAEG